MFLVHSAYIFRPSSVTALWSFKTSALNCFNMNIKVQWSFKTSRTTCPETQCDIAADTNLQQYHCENLICANHQTPMLHTHYHHECCYDGTFEALVTEDWISTIHKQTNIQTNKQTNNITNKPHNYHFHLPISKHRVSTWTKIQCQVLGFRVLKVHILVFCSTAPYSKLDYAVDNAHDQHRIQ